MKVLVIRFSSIGDIILTSPVLRVIHTQLNADIHFVTKKAFVPLVQHSPYVSKVHALDKEMSGLITRLKDERYDLVLDLHKNLRSKRMRLALGVRSVTFDKINWQKWLAVHVSDRFLPDKHLVDRYYESLRPLNVSPDGNGLEYFMPGHFELGEKLKSKVSALLDRSGHDRYAVLAPFAAHYTKSMPPELISSLLDGLDIPIIMIGGAGDREILEDIGSNYANALSLAGETDLHGSATLIRQSAVVISADTGMMHIAAAYRKPIVSVWGSTIPEFGMYPYYGDHKVANARFEVSGLSCRPCSKIGFSTCPKGHFKCMKEQPISSIIQKVLDYFEF